MNDGYMFEYVADTASDRTNARWAPSGIPPSLSDRLEYFGLMSAWMAAVEAG